MAVQVCSSYLQTANVPPFLVVLSVGQVNVHISSPSRRHGSVRAHAFRIMTETLLLESEPIRETFREWHAERESLDAQLAESLSALAAYQSHLDTWQQELAQKREELHKAREQFDTDRAAVEKSKAHLEELTVEVSELRDKISSLNVSLTDRTEELHAQARRRDELVAELEASRAREKELQTALEERTRVYELEREKWEAELRQIRDEATRRGLAPTPNGGTDAEIAPTQESPAPSTRSGVVLPGDSPVLESIVQQFGKLRQQRATDREALRRQGNNR
jgi:DNA repair exonuclease SbcCD ATPase subunit